MTNKASILELVSICISDGLYIQADFTANIGGVDKPLLVEAERALGPIAVHIDDAVWKETDEDALDFAATHYDTILALLEEELALFDKAALVW
ncbi:hypothetical protein [Sedimentimonas flavescens]|uniref:hypothetical protein n=1 Tax=Sedimentimonas flavescens TaxID=2851012 RepID=UPI001C4A2C86|nr:hypothetical protein [Sedimentimonas flavescens]MBW0157620.1 hypothetical protein [Sedimentimonas flavescens]